MPQTPRGSHNDLRWSLEYSLLLLFRHPTDYTCCLKQKLHKLIMCWCRFIWQRNACRVRRFFGKPEKNDVFWKPKYLMLLLEKNRKTEKTGGKRGETKKNRYFTEIEPYLYEFDAIESTSSKYLTFNILREYWVACYCCVFFYRSFDFRTYF
jgi:hypothetical protein